MCRGHLNTAALCCSQSCSPASQSDVAALNSWQYQSNRCECCKWTASCSTCRQYNEALLDTAGQLLLSMAQDGVTPVSDQTWSNYLLSCNQLLHCNSKFLSQAAPYVAAVIRRPNTNPQVLTHGCTCTRHVARCGSSSGCHGPRVASKAHNRTPPWTGSGINQVSNSRGSHLGA